MEKKFLQKVNKGSSFVKRYLCQDKGGRGFCRGKLPYRWGMIFRMYQFRSHQVACVCRHPVFFLSFPFYVAANGIGNRNRDVLSGN